MELSFSIKLILIVVLLVILTFSSKVNFFLIIKHHFQTFKFYKGDVEAYKNSRIRKRDIIFFFIVPFIVSILVNLEFLIKSNNIGLIVTIFSIFTGLLFNLLLLIYDIMNKEKDNEEEQKKHEKHKEQKKLFIKEIYFNISFSILLSVIIICFSIFLSFGIKNLNINIILSVLVLYFIIIFILTILMILKRIHSLLYNEFDHD